MGRYQAFRPVKSAWSCCSTQQVDSSARQCCALELASWALAMRRAVRTSRKRQFVSTNTCQTLRAHDAGFKLTGGVHRRDVLRRNIRQWSRFKACVAPTACALAQHRHTALRQWDSPRPAPPHLFCRVPPRGVPPVWGWGSVRLNRQQSRTGGL